MVPFISRNWYAFYSWLLKFLYQKLSISNRNSIDVQFYSFFLALSLSVSVFSFLFFFSDWALCRGLPLGDQQHIGLRVETLGSEMFWIFKHRLVLHKPHLIVKVTVILFSFFAIRYWGWHKLQFLGRLRRNLTFIRVDLVFVVHVFYWWRGATTEIVQKR
jgi:hypothetical protein